MLLNCAPPHPVTSMPFHGQQTRSTDLHTGTYVQTKNASHIVFAVSSTVAGVVVVVSVPRVLGVPAAQPAAAAVGARLGMGETCFETVRVGPSPNGLPASRFREM